MSKDIDASLPWLDAIRWNSEGLITVVAQEIATGTVLMVAWMNREALQKTLDTGEAVYFSRSRQRLWHKGESSGHTQKVHGIFLDCDGDAIVLHVEQVGGISCHTGRHHCFFYKLNHTPSETRWEAVYP